MPLFSALGKTSIQPKTARHRKSFGSVLQGKCLAMNVQHGRGGSFLFVCACTIVTLIRFLCHLDVFFGIQVDMVVVVGGTSGETEKADCRRMGWKLGCFQRGFFFFFFPSRFVFTTSFPPCFGLQRSLHYFRLLSLHSLFPPCSSTHCDQPKKRTM